jgi:carbon-monoxide dehydrogenase medium subunit
METETASGELLTAVRIPRYPREARFGFHKICRKTGEFADAIAVVVAIPQHAYMAAVVGPTSGPPVLMEMRKVNWPRTAMTLDEAKAILGAAHRMGRPTGDDYERTLHAVALKRAYDEALAV